MSFSPHWLTYSCLHGRNTGVVWRKLCIHSFPMESILLCVPRSVIYLLQQRHNVPSVTPTIFNQQLLFQQSLSTFSDIGKVERALGNICRPGSGKLVTGLCWLFIQTQFCMMYVKESAWRNTQDFKIQATLVWPLELMAYHYLHHRVIWSGQYMQLISTYHQMFDKCTHVIDFTHNIRVYVLREPEEARQSEKLVITGTRCNWPLVFQCMYSVRPTGMWIRLKLWNRNGNDIWIQMKFSASKSVLQLLRFSTLITAHHADIICCANILGWIAFMKQRTLERALGWPFTLQNLLHQDDQSYQCMKGMKNSQKGTSCQSFPRKIEILSRKSAYKHVKSRLKLNQNFSFFGLVWVTIPLT